MGKSCGHVFGSVEVDDSKNYKVHVQVPKSMNSNDHHHHF